MPTVTYRPGTLDDTPAIFQVFLQSVNDLLVREGLKPMTDTDDPEDVERTWANWRPILEHVAATVDQYWVAEQDHDILGYARSLMRDNVRQLTEFFIVPEAQGRGMGRELLQRAFPMDDTATRVVMSSDDARALVLYLKSRVQLKFPILWFDKSTPEVQPIETDLIVEPMTDSSETFSALNIIDQAVIGYRREVDHRWFMNAAGRTGHVFKRDEDIVGYGYFGQRSDRRGACGPIAMLNAEDIPVVMTLGENLAAENDHNFCLYVPLVNRTAVNHLCSRGFIMETEGLVYYMTAKPLGQHDRYVISSPSIFT